MSPPYAICMREAGTLATVDDHPGYVLVTPARNERANIGSTLDSVIGQTVPPRAWVVVSDGSTDGTDQLVADYARRHHFVHLLRRERHGSTDFAAKVHAFNAGYAHLQAVEDLEFDFVGNLDADVSFEPDYFARVLDAFARQPDLGVAGGIVLERIGSEFVAQHISLNSVAGAVQMFRRQCFEAVSGFIPIPGGGEDATAQTLARMKGWTVATLPDLPVLHHGRVLGGARTVVQARFRRGVNNYIIGYHPLFQVASSLSRAVERPYVIGGLSALAGYCWAAARRPPRPVPADIVHFLRREQLQRLRPGVGSTRPTSGPS